MIYTKYHPTTGDVTSNLTITDLNSIKDNLTDDNYLEGHFHTDTHYIDVATKTAIAKPAKPSANHDWDSTNKVWAPNNDKLIKDVRTQRNVFLQSIDRINPVWFASLTADQQNDLKQYRQQLLDVPQQAGFPANVVWPNKPTWLA